SAGPCTRLPYRPARASPALRAAESAGPARRVTAARTASVMCRPAPDLRPRPGPRRAAGASTRGTGRAVHRPTLPPDSWDTTGLLPWWSRFVDAVRGYVGQGFWPARRPPAIFRLFTDAAAKRVRSGSPLPGSEGEGSKTDRHTGHAYY